MNRQDYVSSYLGQVAEVAGKIDAAGVRKAVKVLMGIKRKKGRLFFIGVGGGAANASHAVNDFRKIAGFEAYTPVDNAAELTARINDEGWESSFARWLGQSNLSARDGVFVFSVGGGDERRKISANIVAALKFASRKGARIIGIVGRDGGYTARVADAAILVPVVDPHAVTVHTESFQAVIWHLLVSHPALQASAMKWESVR